MSNNTNFEHIPQEKFRFVQMDAQLHDKRLETKSRSFFQDALLRFSKNKSSVVAAWILAFLGAVCNPFVWWLMGYSWNVSRCAVVCFDLSDYFGYCQCQTGAS